LPDVLVVFTDPAQEQQSSGVLGDNYGRWRLFELGIKYYRAKSIHADGRFGIP
jgi:hypothetical protein